MASHGHRRHFIVGIGDDAAAWRGDAPVQLATTDALIEDAHFTLSTTSWEDRGWKSLAASLGDIAAMGRQPEHVLVSLALPGDTEVDDVLSFYRCMIELADKHDAVIAGSDTANAAHAERVRQTVACPVTVIGEITDGLGVTAVVDCQGNPVELTGSGRGHFAAR
jgi:thiamine monophosphate kinase